MRTSHLFCLLPLLILCACGKESTSNIAQRDQDRAQEGTSTIFKEYQLAEGRYEGTTSVGQVTLNIEATSTKADGTNAPVPTLTGALTFYPQIAMPSNQPLQVAFAIVSGDYFRVSKKMTLRLSDSLGSPNLSCIGTTDVNCTWTTTRGTLNFAVHKLGNEDQLALPTTVGIYRGKAGQFNVEARFETVFTQDPNGGIVQPKISAQFDFLSGGAHAILVSRTGSFDPFLNAVAFGFDGEAPIVANCRILPSMHMHCLWSSNHSFEFDLTPTAPKSNPVPPSKHHHR